jgi:hypothetical protein
MTMTSIVSLLGRNCPARKIPSSALFRVPPPDFLGSESFQIEINEGKNKQAKASYQITVQEPANK